MKTTLTIEESAKLIELGVDPKLASSHTLGVQTPTGITNVYRKVEEGKPIFTLSDILSILPKEIEVDKVELSLVIEWQYNKWYACYMGRGRMAGDCSAPELIDALYQLLIWAIENNFVNLNKEKK